MQFLLPIYLSIYFSENYQFFIFHSLFFTPVKDLYDQAITFGVKKSALYPCSLWRMTKLREKARRMPLFWAVGTPSRKHPATLKPVSEFYRNRPIERLETKGVGKKRSEWTCLVKKDIHGEWLGDVLREWQWGESSDNVGFPGEETLDAFSDVRWKQEVAVDLLIWQIPETAHEKFEYIKIGLDGKSSRGTRWFF